jgi:hypothetical protein
MLEYARISLMRVMAGVAHVTHARTLTHTHDDDSIPLYPCTHAPLSLYSSRFYPPLHASLVM